MSHEETSCHCVGGGARAATAAAAAAASAGRMQYDADGAPGVALAPPPHGVQVEADAAPTAAEYVSAGHGVHAAAPAAAHVPAGHAAHAALPFAAALPAAQGRHASGDDAPDAAEAVPPGQRAHVTAPGIALYSPGRHARQFDASADPITLEK